MRDCFDEAFEAEAIDWENGIVEAPKRTRKENRITSTCYRKALFTVREIDIKDGKLILNTCDCDGVELCDGQRFVFRICPCIPRDGCRPRQVYIKVGCKVFPLVDQIGDYVFENQITNNHAYRGYYGADPEHVIAYNVFRIPRW